MAKKVKTQAELERMKAEFAEEERRAQELLELEITQVKEEISKEIENESAYYRNCLDIGIVKLRKETEAEIERLAAERYADLGATEAAVSVDAQSAADELAKLNTAEQTRQLDKERLLFESQARERRARFEQHMMQLMQGGYKDGKNIDYLKKAVVPIVNSTGMRMVADEAVFDRYQIKITRNALATGESWALYRGAVGPNATVCLITVLGKVPIEVRNQYPNSTKCMRFLMEKPLQPSFIKLYEIFMITGQKMYIFMEPMENHRNAAQLMADKNKGTLVPTSNVDKWCRQLSQAYAYMHSFAIAHLNIRTENVLFDDAANAKVAGMSRAFLYFSLDQEAFIKPPKVENEPYNSHLPPEAFEGPFNAQPADVYSLGLLIYELATGHNPLKKVMQGTKQQQPSKTSGGNVSSSGSNEKLGGAAKLVTNRYDPKLFDFSKLTNAAQRALVERMLSIGILGRPKFSDILTNEYIGANGSDGRTGTPAGGEEVLLKGSSSRGNVTPKKASSARKHSKNKGKPKHR